MNKRLKVLFSIDLLCFAFILASCGNSLSFKKTDLSVDVPAQVFEQVTTRSAYSDKGVPVQANVELFVDGKSFALDSQDYLEGNEESVKFLFRNIPIDSRASAQVTIIQDGVELAQGDSVTITVKSGRNKITVPLALIKYSVPRTKYMLSNLNADGTSNYYLCDTPDAVISPTAKPDFENVQYWCFDADGNVFAVTKKTVIENQGTPEDPYLQEVSEIWLVSNKKGFENRKLYNDYDMEYVIDMFCDMVTNEVYLYISADTTHVIKRLSDEKTCGISPYDLFNIIDPTHDENEKNNSLKFYAYDNYFYVLVQNTYNDDEKRYKLSKIKVSDSKDDQYSFEMENESSALSINYNTPTQDFTWGIYNLIYQDGFVYLLVTVQADFDIGTFGDVLKIDFEHKRITNLNPGTDILDPKTKGKFNIYKYESNEGVQKYYPIYVQEPSNRYMLDYSEYTFGDRDEIFGSKVYGPGSLNSKKIFDPGQFIALKPKKLVISDDGVCYYVDTDGIFKYKNANRVITIDLDDFTISSVKQANVEFYTDTKTPLTYGYVFSYFIDDLADNEKYKYENDSGNIVDFSTDNQDIQFCFTNADN